MTASLILQGAVYDQLNASASLQTLIGNPPRIYDDVPEETLFPYLTIGEVKEVSYPAHEGALTHDLRLHAWSRYNGHFEIKSIMQAVHDALHEADLSLEGHQLVSLRYVFGDVFRRAEVETYHAVMRYRAITVPEGT